jgi:hypothetical protein
MSNECTPLVGTWYEDEAGNSFEVIFADEAGDTIEIQYFDGTVESMDLESWTERTLAPTEPPGDVRGTFDDLEEADLDDTAAAMKPHDWGNPLDTLDTGSED